MTTTDRSASASALDDEAVTSAESQPQTQPCPDLPLSVRVEAILLAADRPLSDARIADLLVLGVEDGGTKAVREAVDELNQQYEQGGRSFRIESVAGGRQIMTLASVAPVVSRLRAARQQTRLSPAALETLAIVAYRQPILRAELEAIRGVACGEVLRSLMERRMVRIVGRAEELGRPMLYGTTREFLNVFGLASLEDLPQARDLR
jgi:segregation and condensation protein B